MKTLVIVLGVVAVLFVACANSKTTINPTTTPAELATPTSNLPITVVTPSLPCYTPSSELKPTIIAAISKEGGKVEKETFTIWIDGNCVRGTLDWTLTNKSVQEQPGIEPSQVVSPDTQLSEWAQSVGISAPVQNDISWFGANIGPTSQVCTKLQLKCED